MHDIKVLGECTKYKMSTTAGERGEIRVIKICMIKWIIYTYEIVKNEIKIWKEGIKPSMLKVRKSQNL